MGYLYKPYSAEALDEYTGRYSPNTRKINSEAFWFWVRAFFGRAISVIDFDVIPEWDDDTLDVLYFWLYRDGVVGVLDSEEYGLVFQFGKPYGFNLYYKPKKFIIANANAPELDGEYEIGKDIALLKLTPDMRGIYDIIAYFAEKMSLLDNSINISLENLKLTKILTAKNKAAAETLKKIHDKANKGESLVITDVLLKDDANGESNVNIYDLPNIKNSYILTDQLQDMKRIIDMFDAEIGIPTLLNEKKERMVSQEASYSQSSARAEIWVRTLNKSFNRINKMFGVNMSARLHYNYDEGGVEDGNDEPNSNIDGT